MGATSGDRWVVCGHGRNLVDSTECQEENRVRGEDNLCKVCGGFNIVYIFFFVAVYRSLSSSPNITQVLATCSVSITTFELQSSH